MWYLREYLVALSPGLLCRKTVIKNRIAVFISRDPVLYAISWVVFFLGLLSFLVSWFSLSRSRSHTAKRHDFLGWISDDHFLLFLLSLKRYTRIQPINHPSPPERARLLNCTPGICPGIVSSQTLLPEPPPPREFLSLSL